MKGIHVVWYEWPYCSFLYLVLLIIFAKQNGEKRLKRKGASPIWENFQTSRVLQVPIPN